jgi:hypothetical protein
MSDVAKPHIVLIGNSSIGLNAFEQFLVKHGQAKLTWVCPEDQLIVKEYLFDVLHKTIPLSKLARFSKQDVPAGNITVRPEQPKRINVKRKRITLPKNEVIHYDQLLLADTCEWSIKNLKGKHRDGVMTLRTSADVRYLLHNIARMDTLVIQSSSLNGLILTELLSRFDKHILWMLPDVERFPLPLEWLESWFKDHSQQQITLCPQHSVHEVLGDQVTKAVRIETGKVLAAECVIMPDHQPEWRCFTGVDGDSLADVSAAVAKYPDVHFIDEWDMLAQRQGQSSLFSTQAWVDRCVDILVDRLMEKHSVVDHPGYSQSTWPVLNGVSKNWQCEIFGVISGGQALSQTEDSGDRPQFKKVFFDQYAPVGACLINADPAYRDWLKVQIEQNVSFYRSEHNVFTPDQVSDSSQATDVNEMVSSGGVRR